MRKRQSVEAPSTRAMSRLLGPALASLRLEYRLQAVPGSIEILYAMFSQ